MEVRHCVTDRVLSVSFTNDLLTYSLYLPLDPRGVVLCILRHVHYPEKVHGKSMYKGLREVEVATGWETYSP